MGQFRPLFVYFRLFYVSQFKRNLIKVTMVCLGFEPVAAEWKAQTNPISFIFILFCLSLVTIVAFNVHVLSLCPSLPTYLLCLLFWSSLSLCAFSCLLLHYVSFLFSSSPGQFFLGLSCTKKEIFQLSGRRFHGVAGLQPPSQRRKSGPTYL